MNINNTEFRNNTERVRHIMATEDRDLTLDEIQALLAAQNIRISQTAVSARVRDLRKPEFGGGPETVKRTHITGGLHVYRYQAFEAGL